MKWMSLVVAIVAFGVVTPVQAQVDDRSRVAAVLDSYRSAIESLDAAGTERLFTEDAVVYEQGGVEGSYARYLEHHLGPELEVLSSFDFQNWNSEIQVLGDLALATETYTYHIRFTDEERPVIDRRGVATSVLRRDADGEWRILRYHSSARPITPASH